MTQHEAPARRRAMPTRDELRVWRGYIETAEAVRSRLEGQLQRESGLSSADYRVLLALSEADARTLRSSELAELIGWERSRLSHHLGRMEKRGLVHRTPCPGVAHGVEVTLTGDGAQALRRSSVPHLQAVHELFLDVLTPEQLAHVDDLTATLRRRLALDPEPDRPTG